MTAIPPIIRRPLDLWRRPRRPHRAGLMWTDHYLGSHADSGRRLSRLAISPSGILAAAAGARGTYSLLQLTF